MSMLAIKGHSTRGKEVIALLEMLGGNNKYHINITECNLLYTIREGDDVIIGTYPNSSISQIYTLEQFLEKYPYKVGNKVNYVKYNDADPNVYTIQRMQWTGATIEYLLDSSGFSALTKDLQPYKEETIKEEEENFVECMRTAVQECLFGEEETIEEITIDIPKGYEFAGIDDNRQQVVFTKIQPEYPTTYEECCKIKQSDPNFYIDTHLYSNKLEALYKLLICRDAYWKLAGEQMGLGKPWEPDWSTENDIKYVIEVYRNNVRKNSQGYFNIILAFPSAEMRDAFKENFDSDIDACKEFL